MGRLTKFWFLTSREKKFLFEASIFLSLSNACLRAIAFRHIVRFLRARYSRDARDEIACEQEMRLVQRSISRAANILPWKTRCLSQSIAEFLMLRRRGIPAVISAGVRFSGHTSLEAHAWVDSVLGASDRSFENTGFATVLRISSGTVD
jgi:hypothetical protein